MDEEAYVEAAVRRELEVYDSWKPDFVVTENQFTIAVSARVSNIPYGATAASVNLPSFVSPLYTSAAPPPAVERAYHSVLARHGIRSSDDIGSLVHEHAKVNLAPTLLELEPDLAVLPRVFFVGPLLDSGIEVGPAPASLAQQDGRSPVYVYMSVGVMEPQDYIPMLREVSRSTQFTFYVASRASSINGQETPFRQDCVHVFDRLPGLTMIRECAALVGRSGQNAVMGAILSGKPMIGFYGHSAEAYFNVQSVRGYPEIIEGKNADLSVERLAELLLRAAANGSSVAYAALGDRLRAAGGLTTALGVVEAA